MKFEFDSNNATELRAVEAAVAVLLGKQARSPEATPTTEEWAKAVEAAPAAPTAEEWAKAVEATHTPQDLAAAFNEMANDVAGAAQPSSIIGKLSDTTEELDSAGQPWNPELHSSSRAKVADGTWKKKRGVKAEVPQPLVDVGEFPKIPDAPIPSVPAPPTPVTPPAPPVPAVLTPPAPQADGLVTMNDIWALVTNGKTTITVVRAAAQRMGFADLGKVAQTATAEQRAALLKELTA